MLEKQYIAIDLKSFYASVECVERGLNPLTTNLVVADESRTQKTICLAVTPSLKAMGVGGRPRLFEVYRDINRLNASKAPGDKITFIIAPPRMQLYINYSARIYNIYLKYVAAEDIHVYSVDEVFIDITPYLKLNKKTPRDFAMTIIRDVLRTTGITATAGIGTNLYLAKVAMDIVAKKMKADADGVRIAQLDEISYRQKLWNHRPLTDFWRVGPGIQRRLAEYGLQTMGDIARCSISHQEHLFKMFGINAELLIDHAWGIEPVTIAQIKAYQPQTHSTCNGQVLTEPYTSEKARNVVLEMSESLALDLVKTSNKARAIVLYIGYDVESLIIPHIAATYDGPVHVDHYGRVVPQHSQSTHRFSLPTNSVMEIVAAAGELYDSICKSTLLIRRLSITASELISENAPSNQAKSTARQLTLFDEEELPVEDTSKKLSPQKKERENKLNNTIVKIKNIFGKNSVLKGLNFASGATGIERNRQIGGHKA